MSHKHSSLSPLPIAFVFLMMSAILAVVQNNDRSYLRTDYYDRSEPARIESVLAQLPDHLAEFKNAGASGVFLEVAFRKPCVFYRQASLRYDNLVLLRLKTFRSNPLSHYQVFLLLKRSHRWHCSPDEFPTRAA